MMVGEEEKSALLDYRAAEKTKPPAFPQGAQGIILQSLPMKLTYKHLAAAV